MAESQSPNFFNRAVKYLAAKRYSSWVLERILYRLDNLTLRVTKGKRNLTTLLTGLPIITLETTGAKSGQPRVSPLVGIPMGEEMILIGSNFGGVHSPGWYYNLVAQPEALIRSGDSEKHYIARQVYGDEWERCWQITIDLYAGYQAYGQRASHRQIPIMLMTPVGNKLPA